MATFLPGQSVNFVDNNEKKLTDNNEKNLPDNNDEQIRPSSPLPDYDEIKN